MSRTHIHLAQGVPGSGTISGKIIACHTVRSFSSLFT
jgi:hypothetical protein